MYQFPKGLFCDVRLETTDSATILVNDGKLMQNKTRSETGAMIRVFDGCRWYYSAVTELDSIQKEIDTLAALATPNPDIENHPMVRALEVNKAKQMRYEKNDVRKVPGEKKRELLFAHQAVFDEFPAVKGVQMIYSDRHLEKHILSSLGTDVHFDQQFASVNFTYTVVGFDQPQPGRWRCYKTDFDSLTGTKESLKEEILKDIEYAEKAQPIEAGVYTCVFSPITAGVFAHESFGHKSEADFMVGDETMKREWKLGTKVGSENLNIIDSGIPEGSGYVPFDDEGCRAKETYLIKNGILTGRLHSAATAADLGEEVTGNARAMSFEYEPIVRMTSTYIGAGTQTKEELFAGVQDGVYVCDFKHGSGMSTFTIAPSKAYRIRNGKIAEPVRVSVVSGNVMETLHKITGLSKEFTLCSSALGGCGKMEQYPLPVAFGGPYVRVDDLQVQ